MYIYLYIVIYNYTYIYIYIYIYNYALGQGPANLREFACELTSSWPPARVEGRVRLAWPEAASAE